MVAAVKATFKQIKERVEATIMLMQRALGSLQTECDTLRTNESDDVMIWTAAAYVKPLRVSLNMSDVVPTLFD